jgi:hypothetical protein
VNEVLAALIICLCLAGGALGGRYLNAKLPPESLHDDAQAMVRLIVNFLVVTASLSLGLMLNSAKNALDTNNRNVHAFATELILLDRTIRAIGPAGEEAHRALIDYTRIALADRYVVDDNPRAEAAFEGVGASLRGIRMTGEQDIAVWNDARAAYREAIRLRLIVVDAAGQTVPTPLIVLLVVWLVIIFTSFGYRAPRVGLVTAAQVVAAILIAAAFWLILDMDSPTAGFIVTSNAPLQRALTEIDR